MVGDGRKKITIYLPLDLYNEIERYMKENFYTSVSELVRTVMRDFLKKEGGK